MADTEADETAIETLRSLGFRGESTRSPAPDVRFTRDDCAVFRRYPKSVPWKDDLVDPADQARFRSIWERLKPLAEWLVREVDDRYPPMEGKASQYQANGRSQADIWCCIFPSQAVHKSYALQVALIISADGAEVCLCLSAGRSRLKEPELSAAQRAFRELKSHLASVPPHVALAVEGSLPSRAVLRTSWREPGESQFKSVGEWAAYAGGPEGAQASISVFVTPEELELLADQIANVLREMAKDAAPLFGYCYDVVQAGETEAEDHRSRTRNCAAGAVIRGRCTVTGSGIARRQDARQARLVRRAPALPRKARRLLARSGPISMLMRWSSSRGTSMAWNWTRACTGRSWRRSAAAST